MLFIVRDGGVLKRCRQNVCSIHEVNVWIAPGVLEGQVRSGREQSTKRARFGAVAGGLTLYYTLPAPFFLSKAF